MGIERLFDNPRSALPAEPARFLKGRKLSLIYACQELFVPKRITRELSERLRTRAVV